MHFSHILDDLHLKFTGWNYPQIPKMAWDSTLYKVVGVPRDNLVSVYTVESVDSPGKTKKVH